MRSATYSAVQFTIISHGLHSSKVVEFYGQGHLGCFYHDTIVTMYSEWKHIKLWYIPCFMCLIHMIHYPLLIKPATYWNHKNSDILNHWCMHIVQICKWIISLYMMIWLSHWSHILTYSSWIFFLAWLWTVWQSYSLLYVAWVSTLNSPPRWYISLCLTLSVSLLINVIETMGCCHDLEYNDMLPTHSYMFAWVRNY